MADYKQRIADALLERKLAGKGAVLIEGPKWCGKTTTAEQHAKSILRLVFAAADEAVCGPSEAFAFISDGNLIVNGTGTLQVIDMLGHQLLNRDIHSTFCIQHSAFSIYEGFAGYTTTFFSKTLAE